MDQKTLVILGVICAILFIIMIAAIIVAVKTRGDYTKRTKHRVAMAIAIIIGIILSPALLLGAFELVLPIGILLMIGAKFFNPFHDDTK